MAGQQSMKSARPEVGRQRPSPKTPHAQPRQVLGDQSAMLRRLGPEIGAADGGSRALFLAGLQTTTGNRAVQRLLIGIAAQRAEGSGTAPASQPNLAVTDLGGILAEATRRIAGLLAGGAAPSANRLTDDLFYFAYPGLAGEKIKPGTPAAQAWLKIRDRVVIPLLRPKPGAAPAGDQVAGGVPKAAVPDGMVPAGHLAADSATTATQAPAASRPGTADKYFTQDAGHYQDTDNGKVRLWLYGSSGANVCNMTSLTMSLVSIAGEGELRSKLVGLLRSGGIHEGASVTVGSKWVPLAEALADPTVISRVETIDLVTAAAIGTSGGYGSVTEAGTIARIAKATGLAGAEVATGKTRLTDPGVRAATATLLAGGTRIIAGTVNHYVYLIEIRDDGVILHDPAGSRVTPGLSGMLFLHNGNATRMAREFLAMDAERRQRAIRHLSTNPAAAAIVNELPAIAAMARAEQAAAIKELAKAHPGYISTGATNFYANAEFAENDLRLRVKLTAKN